MNSSQFSLKPTTITNSAHSLNNSLNSSLYHSKNQQISNQQLNISIPQQIQNNPKPQTQIFTCRVCLAEVQATKIKSSGLISPCLCTGSVRYVHEECLKYWLNSIITRNLQQNRNTYGVFCELCKQPYIYSIETKWTCSSKQQIKNRIQQNKLSLTISLILATASILSIITIGILSGLGKMKYSQEDSGYTVFYISFAIFLVLLIMWIARMIQLYILKEINFIKSVKQRRLHSGTIYMQNTLSPFHEGSINF